jgi:integrase
MSGRVPTLRRWYEKHYRPTLEISEKRLEARDLSVAEFERFAGVGVSLTEVTNRSLHRFIEEAVELRPQPPLPAPYRTKPLELADLKALADLYHDRRPGVDDGKTRQTLRERLHRCCRELVASFGEGCQLEAISRRDAQAWRRSLRDRFTEATVRALFGCAKKIFGWLLGAGALDENPFETQTPEARRRNRAAHVRSLRQIVLSWDPKAFSEEEAESTPPEGSLRRHFEAVYLPTEMFDKQPASQADTRRAIRRLDEFYDRFVMLAELSDSLAADFFRGLIGEGYPAATVNKFRRNLFAVWRHAEQAGLVRRPPNVRKLQELHEDPDAWSVAEFARILDAASRISDDGLYGKATRAEWWTAVLNCAYWTGLRRSSILRIQRSHLDLDTGWLSIPSRNMKTKRAKRCRLAPTAIAAVERLVAKLPRREQLIFLPHPTLGHLNRPFDEILSLAGVPLSRRRGMNRFHKIRRTAATAAYEAGGIAAASALLDHSDPRTTFRHYIDGRAIRDNDATLVLPALSLKLA